MMKKRMILASLVAFMLIGTPVVEAETTHMNETPYVDISGHWAEQQINQLYIANVIGQNEYFRPDDNVTLGELLTMFVNAKGIEPLGNKQSSFADVPANSWLSSYAETAYRLGIVHGQKQGNYLYLHPDAPVKRAELASILVRTMGDSGVVNNLKWSTTIQTLNQYADGSNVNEKEQRPLVYAMENGLMSAYEDGTLKPDKYMTRAEAATYAALDLLPGKPRTTKALANGTPFRQEITVQTTAYSYTNDKILSYLEYPLREGVVAVDPNVIPLGKHLYIDGYGYAVAADIGGAVKQRHVDLYLPTLNEAENHGLQKGVKVYVLD
ncbi:S-layer homology domain-containing protein [Brevibacillus brevis]|uniref:S-layer homology domain-containing protein n=1 Tax=Brevibacillus brevis TaxID=1393 RepID=UPI001F3EB951|nr:S-layer homology domain-containing protein [Brevibacillus brevis]UIO40956.1 S-layer homology domain-containing protein [Brevibacillus brevis]